jgi:hypothetical protein
MDHTILISIPLQSPLTESEFMALKRSIAETLYNMEQYINISDIECFVKR